METKKQKLIKGVSALMFGSNAFFIILLIVVMTPDPLGEIHYTGTLFILLLFVCIAFYGIRKLDNLGKTLNDN